MGAWCRAACSGWDDGIALEPPELRTIAGRVFLVGNTVERVHPEWAAGPPTSVAWDAVTAFMTYPTREAFVAACDRAAAEGSARPVGLFNRIFGKS